MGKKLSQMSLEELWQLFPIILTEHNAMWREWYAEEETFLHVLLPQAARISHIGSTAIRGIWAKPIIDILVELPESCNFAKAKEILTNHEYICMSQGNKRLSFNKGYTENGFAQKVFHLHLRVLNDHDELYFRDYLNDHPDIASEYELLKIELWKKFEHDRDEYTRQKTEFVTTYTNEAKQRYGRKY